MCIRDRCLKACHRRRRGSAMMTARSPLRRAGRRPPRRPAGGRRELRRGLARDLRQTVQGLRFITNVEGPGPLRRRPDGPPRPFRRLEAVRQGRGHGPLLRLPAQRAERAHAAQAGGLRAAALRPDARAAPQELCQRGDPGRGRGARRRFLWCGERRRRADVRREPARAPVRLDCVSNTTCVTRVVPRRPRRRNAF